MLPADGSFEGLLWLILLWATRNNIGMRPLLIYSFLVLARTLNLASGRPDSEQEEDNLWLQWRLEVPPLSVARLPVA